MTMTDQHRPEQDLTDEPLLRAEGVEVVFPIRGGMFRRTVELQAVRGVSLDIDSGQAVGLVGESGSGKSTMARALLRLVPVRAGSVRLRGVELVGKPERQIRPYRREAQMVFQDPYSSLDPSTVIGEIVAEPLRVHSELNRAERWEAAEAALERVGLSASAARRYSYEFSGGQRQRIAIARAIVTHPRLIILDEAVSALDMSTQNQVLDLLVDLREEMGVGMLFVSHDLAVVRWIADWTAVMYLGRIVEAGPTERLYQSPAHPYTQSLLDANLTPNPRLERGKKRVVLEGEIPDPINPPSGCAFRTRCPAAHDRCAVAQPVEIAVEGGGWAACHLLS